MNLAADNGPQLPTQADPAAPQPLVRAPFSAQARVCLACGVRRSALFGAIDLQALEHLHVHIADVALEPGQHLFNLYDAGAAAYTVREGVLRLERCNERGDRRIVRLAGPGELVGMEAMVGQTYATDAVACTPVRACRLPRGLVDMLSADQPAMLHDLMKRWQAALDETEEWLTELSTGEARWRMLRLLLKLSEYGSADGLVWLPARQEIGAMLDITVETASRLVAALKREGVLETPDARHARLNMPRLFEALRGAGAVS